ncbi:MAG: M3 family oligoendopeptidase [Anaerolineaceae bacterium]|nr:M3 family oligoendopeptidase [Anaerolineaceae bacterium]
MDQTTSFAQTRWSLTDLFPSYDKPALEAAFKRLEKQVSLFEKRRAQLSAAIADQDFLSIVGEIEGISRESHVLYSFVGLWFAEDTQSQEAQALMGQMDQFMAELGNRTLFFSLWWKDLDDANAERLMATAGDYRYWLEEMRHFKPYTLSEPEEKIINIKNVTGASAIQMLYDSITNRYSFKLEVDGETRELTRGELMVYVRGHDPQLRARAYQELYRVFGEDGAILGQMYQAMARDWGNEQVTLRHFPTPISARNLYNDIPDDVVETLLDVSKKNSGIFQYYFRLKARWLGLERLRRYDVYAPVDHSEKTYAYDQAADMVFASFNSFHPRFAEMAQRVFAQNHLDSEIRKGKRSGAFCWSVLPEMTPWVLLNYQGKAEDVATMAHELGHAIHSMLSAEHNLFTYHASLPLAETASTFGEMMLVDRLLAEEKDEGVRRDMLFKQVDDSYATILRQAYFAIYEKQAHEMISAGASVDDLATAYMENLHDQFGEAVEVPDEFRWEWVSIPHIYQTPFYVYAYSFGQLLVLALYQQYKSEGEGFIPRYLQILSAGGSKSPAHILSEAGIDIHQAAFWQGGFDVVKRLVEQLDAIPLP